MTPDQIVEQVRAARKQAERAAGDAQASMEDALGRIMDSHNDLSQRHDRLEEKCTYLAKIVEEQQTTSERLRVLEFIDNLHIHWLTCVYW